MRVHEISLLIAGLIDKSELLDIGDLTTDERHFKILVKIDLLVANLRGSLRLSKAGDDLIFGLPQVN
jgi:hypothetical protein